MRKLISLNFFVTGLIALGISAQAKTETPKSCGGYLASEVQTDVSNDPVFLINPNPERDDQTTQAKSLFPGDSKVIVLEEPIEEAPAENDADEVIKGYPQKLQDTLAKARAMMDKAKELNFITKSKYDHLLEDLDELSKELDKKSKKAVFTEMTNKWYDFALRLEAQIEAYQALSSKDQKLYYEKMKMPISFMTSHFITFLETKHLKFDYDQMSTILTEMVELDSKADLVLYLYEFEKQVLKFFSRDEFIDCQA